MSKGILLALSHHSEGRERKKKKTSSFVWASFERPPSSNIPELKLTSNAHPFIHIQTLSTQHSHTHTDNSCFSVAHSHKQTMSSSPLTGHPCSPLPSLHFSSHQLCSSPFLLCCGSRDRGIPSLLLPLMGQRTKRKTMYSNGSVELPQLAAKSGFHKEVSCCQFLVTPRQRLSQPNWCCSVCSCFRRQSALFTFHWLFSSRSLPLLIPQSSSSVSAGTSNSMLLEMGWGKKRKKRSDGVFWGPMGLPQNIHMLSDSCLSPFPLWMGSKRSASYKRRDPHPPRNPTTHTFTLYPTAFPNFPFTANAAVSTQPTKTANYCKTSQITFQLSSSRCNQSASTKRLRTNTEEWGDHSKLFLCLSKKSKRRTPEGRF